MNRSSDITRFYIEHLNPRLTSHDPGEDFQKFVHELLIFDFPDLQFFPSRGKDGGVDLLQETPLSYQIFECKYITEDGWEEARNRWRSVAGKLQTNLAAPQGPTTGQSQYNIWYRTRPAIQKYFFCVSSIISPPERFIALQQEIAQFFVNLGTTHNHLAHLTNVEVKIIDWSGICNRLRQHPHLIYRWFPSTRPQGLIPLEEAPDRGTFRSYLSSERLPYYGRSHHLKLVPAPPGIKIPDETNLLSQLRDGNETGLIITGSGGVGKTRLTLEIGHLAQNLGWTVLRVQSRWRDDAIEALAEQFTPETPVLLLIDYVETQRDFQELVEILNSINDNYFLRLRYVANCRTSYYPAVIATSRHFHVDLSPIKHDSAQPWVESYHQQIVRHILEQSGITVTEKHLAVCRDIPILAVFVSYLHQTKRESDLAELLEEADFSTWVAKRMQLSLVDINFSIDRHLALFMALFPIPEDSTSKLDSPIYGLLLDKLATDGWIEKLPPDQNHDVTTWVTAHDVLADQILLSYLSSIHATINRFVREMFAVAYSVGALRSVLITLQRLADQPLLKSLDWLQVLGLELQQEPAAWREVRNILIRTPLLLPQHRIELLGRYKEVWRGSEEETDFQNSLGWLARWAAEQKENKEQQLSPEQHGYLVSCIEKAAPWATQSNYILTGGIRFCPEAVREVALDWILKRPEEFQTHYLMVAWLEQGLRLEDISSTVQKWSARFSRVPNFSFLITAWLRAGGDIETIKPYTFSWLGTYQAHEGASFVYRTWLEAGGDTEAIKQYMLSWLDIYHAHESASFLYCTWLEAGGDTETIKQYTFSWLDTYQAHESASFVYRTWLEAGGDTEAIKQYMLSWLDIYHAHESARFVYCTWLQAGGEFALVRDAAILWLNKNYENAEAVYLTKYLAKQPDIPVETVRNILSWCLIFADNLDALWRLTQLGKHLKDVRVADDVVKASEAVIGHLLNRRNPPHNVTSGQITSLLSYLIEAPALQVGQLRSRVDALLVRWIRNPSSFVDFESSNIYIQRVSNIERLKALLDSGALDISTDREPLERFVRWVNKWDTFNKLKAVSLLNALKREFPAPGLWDIVQFQ